MSAPQKNRAPNPVTRRMLYTVVRALFDMEPDAKEYIKSLINYIIVASNYPIQEIHVYIKPYRDLDLIPPLASAVATANSVMTPSITATADVLGEICDEWNDEGYRAHVMTLMANSWSLLESGVMCINACIGGQSQHINNLKYAALMSRLLIGIMNFGSDIKVISVGAPASRFSNVLRSYLESIDCYPTMSNAEHPLASVRRGYAEKTTVMRYIGEVFERAILQEMNYAEIERKQTAILFRLQCTDPRMLELRSLVDLF